MLVALSCNNCPKQLIATQAKVKGVDKMDSKTGDVIRVLISVVIPPVGVFLEVGFGMHFWINILLTLLGYIPGLIHAIWIIVKNNGG